MGEVYRARDSRLSRDVAIKVLPASFSADADRLRRFEQEAKAAGVLNHPNVTAVYDIGTHDDAPYVVQELLEGETLRSVLAGGKLSARKTLDYSLQIVHGLAAAHEKGIVHRDLKPENIFVTNDGRLKILDFGLAKLTHTEERGTQKTNLPTATAGTEPGVVLGTLGYMSPEQVRGKPADARSDIFSFGAILYEMLSGRRAFHGDSAADTMSAILKEDPPDLSRHEPERAAGARAHRPALPREEPGAALPLGARPGIRPRGALGRFRDGAGPAPPPSGRRSGSGRRIGIAAVLALLALAAGYALGHRKPADATSPRASRFRSSPSARSRSSTPASRPTERPSSTAPRPRATPPRSTRYGRTIPAPPPTGQPGHGAAFHLLEGRARGPDASALPAAQRLPRHARADAARRRRAARDRGRRARGRLEPRRLGPRRSRTTSTGRTASSIPPGKVLAEGGGYFSNPRFSPRGDRIAFFEHPIKYDDRGSRRRRRPRRKEDGPLGGQRGPGRARLVERRKRGPVFRGSLVLRLRDLRREARREAAQHRPERGRPDAARRRPRRTLARQPRRPVEGGPRPRARRRARSATSPGSS